MSKYDIIVVGGGPAGLFACYELIKSGSKLKACLQTQINKNINCLKNISYKSGKEGTL